MTRLIRDSQRQRIPKAVHLNRRKLVYGVGINDVFEVGFTGGRIWKIWQQMIRRTGGRDPKHRFYEYYKDCTMDESWFRLSVFREWVETFDNWEMKEIDKDLLIEGNMHYGPDTCLMVDPVWNGWFKPNAVKGDLPRGVVYASWKKRLAKKPYRAQITLFEDRKIKGKRTHLGSFVTVEMAEDCYKKARKEQIIKQLRLETDLRVIEAVKKREGIQ